MNKGSLDGSDAYLIDLGHHGRWGEGENIGHGVKIADHSLILLEPHPLSLSLSLSLSIVYVWIGEGTSESERRQGLGYAQVRRSAYQEKMAREDGEGSIP